MATLKQVQSKIQELERQASEIRAEEFERALKAVQNKVAKYGITSLDIFGRVEAIPSNVKAALPPKYRDPKTEATWSGRGRAPSWLSGKNRDRFLIKE